MMVRVVVRWGGFPGSGHGDVEGGGPEAVVLAREVSMSALVGDCWKPMEALQQGPPVGSHNQRVQWLRRLDRRRRDVVEQ